MLQILTNDELKDVQVMPRQCPKINKKDKGN